MIENIRAFLEVSKDQKICKRTPTHGPCCTCQDCGYDFDNCQCSDNRNLEVCEYVEGLQMKIAHAKGLNKVLVNDAQKSLDEIDRLTAENEAMVYYQTHPRTKIIRRS